jgi:hypothetical protein
VIVPSSSKKNVDSSVKCFRLVVPDRNPYEDDVTVQPLEDDDDEKDVGSESTGGMISLLLYMCCGHTHLLSDKWSQDECDYP